MGGKVRGRDGKGMQSQLTEGSRLPCEVGVHTHDLGLVQEAFGGARACGCGSRGEAELEGLGRSR